MSIISKFTSYINKKNQIQHTNITNTFTKHGIFQVKIYIHNNQEYLVILSKNFYDLKVPIFYIHNDQHECDSLDEFCGCSYPISVALKMIHNDGGFILYSSRDSNNIDTLLQEINSDKRQLQQKVMTGTNLKSALKGYKGDYLTIDFILKDLKVSHLQLVSDNQNIMFIIQQRGIQIINHTPTISFSYGDSNYDTQSETSKALNAITFEYSNDK